MSRKIVYSAQARQDLRAIYEYIANELGVPDTAANYLVFYLAKENNNVVNIVRIMYGGRDVRKQLSETNEL